MLRNQSITSIFNQVKQAQDELMEKCTSARKDIKKDKRRFDIDEDQLKRLINQ